MAGRKYWIGLWNVFIMLSHFGLNRARVEPGRATVLNRFLWPNQVIAITDIQLLPSPINGTLLDSHRRIPNTLPHSWLISGLSISLTAAQSYLCYSFPCWVFDKARLSHLEVPIAIVRVMHHWSGTAAHPGGGQFALQFAIRIKLPAIVSAQLRWQFDKFYCLSWPTKRY